MVFYVTPGINADYLASRNGRLCKAQPAQLDSIAPLGDNRNGLIYKGDRATFPILFRGKGNPPASVPIIGGKPTSDAKTLASQA
jgi:hypothetical protein